MLELCLRVGKRGSEHIQEKGLTLKRAWIILSSIKKKGAYKSRYGNRSLKVFSYNLISIFTEIGSKIIN